MRGPGRSADARRGTEPTRASLSPSLSSLIPPTPSLQPSLQQASMSSSIDKASSIQTGETDMERAALPVSTFGGRVQRVAELNKGEGVAVQEVRSGEWHYSTLSACRSRGHDSPRWR